MADELARQALCDELGAKRRLERDDRRAFGCDDEPGLGRAGHKHVFGGKLDALNRSGPGETLKRGDSRGDCLHLRPALPAQRLEVRLVADVAELGLVGDIFDLLDVELVHDEVFKPLHVRTGDAYGAERLAHLEVVVGPQAAAELDDGLDGGHALLEREVARGGVCRREVAQVDGLRVVRAPEVGVYLLGDERSEWSRDLRELDEDVAERPVRAELVAVVRGLPEAATRAADVPVGQVLDELDERPHRALQVVGVHRRRNVGDESFHRRNDPPIQDIRGLECLGIARRSLGEGGLQHLCVCKIVYIRVGHEEGIRVPPRNQEVAHELLDAVLGELEVLGANDRRVDHVESNRVGAVGVEHLRRIGVVLEALRHLLAVFRENEPVDDDVPVGRLVEETRAENH